MHLAASAAATGKLCVADREVMEVDAGARGKAPESVALLIVETSLRRTAIVARASPARLAA